MIRCCLALACFSVPLRAADDTAMRAAVSKSLDLIERSSAIAIEERSNCFTCHHTGLPVMTFLTARARGFAIATGNLDAQLRFTSRILEKGRGNYLQGKGQGGAAFMAGSALWTLKLGAWTPDATTEAVIEYLIGHQRELPQWKPPSIRPPSEESAFSATYFALESLAAFATAAQRSRADERTASVKRWLEQAAPATTEDRVFRLWSLHAVGSDTQAATRDVLSIQREDGGWAQLPEMAPDAYATGTALVALHRTGSAKTEDAAFQRGLRWLMENQLADGSWHVATRAKPFQKHFESGYPHGKDQFISITAACWATTALALALPEMP